MDEDMCSGSESAEDDYYDETEMYEDDEVDTSRPVDAEHFDYEIHKTDSIERLFNKNVDSLNSEIMVGPAVSKMLLMQNEWNTRDIAQRYHEDNDAVLIASHVKSSTPVAEQASTECTVCLENHSTDNLLGLQCGHKFCRECWDRHFQVKIECSYSTKIECMQKGCPVQVPEDFAFRVIMQPKLRQQYEDFAFRDSIQSHPELTFCPGKKCDLIVHASEVKAKRVTCKCGTVFCFKCTNDYHAPTDCATIKKWLMKCVDDSETANFISANTKDCPKCNVVIEKNGGCNHMKCLQCQHDFCWVCLGDWKTHGSEYYECSRFKENPSIVANVTSQQDQARKALDKYLFYFRRWENHGRSLSLEQQALERIRAHIDKRLQMNSGSWIDWQYLIDAANLLQKCRYTLKYTYPFAYYMEEGDSKKQIFELQQAELEREVENLSWNIERAEITERGTLENQMKIVEQHRRTLLTQFLES